MQRSFACGLLGSLVLALAPLCPGWCQVPVPPRELPAEPIPAPRATEEQAGPREWELLAEIALLSEPITFASTIKPRVISAELELTGYVPNQFARERALEIVRQACQVPVTDRLAIQSNMALIIPTRMAPRLVETVRARLDQIEPGLGQQIEVRFESPGQAILTGIVDSLVKKAQCSRALRGLPGINCVKNHLEIGIPPAPVPNFEPLRTDHLQPLPEPEAPREMMPRPSPAPRLPLSTGRNWPAPVFPGRDHSMALRGGRASEETGPEEIRFLPRAVDPAPSGQALAGGVPAMVTFEDEGSLPTRPSEVQPASFVPPTRNSKPVPDANEQTRLKHLIIQAGKGEITQASLNFDGNGGLMVSIKVVKNADLPAVLHRVAAMPALDGFDLRIAFTTD